MKAKYLISFVGLLLGAGPAAAPSGAGGGHASAPAGAHGSAAAPTATAAPRATNSPAPAAHPAAAIANNERAQTSQSQHHVDRNQHYQTVYGSPWWPNASGWNSGWYGNGYGNSGYYNDPNYGQAPNTNNANASSGNTNGTPAQNADVSPTSTDTTAIDANRPTAAARAENAVKDSPALTSLNDNIQQAQTAFDSDRERILIGLKTNPDYQKALAARQSASKSVNNTTRPTDGSAPALAMIDVATAKLNAADDVTKMEEQAIAADPKAAADKERLTAMVSQRDAHEAQIRGH